MLWNEELLVPYSTWVHTKTETLYWVLGIATCSTNGDREGKERSVVYVSCAYQKLRYREVGEFLDGRFTPVLPKES